MKRRHFLAAIGDRFPQTLDFFGPRVVGPIHPCVVAHGLIQIEAVRPGQVLVLLEHADLLQRDVDRDVEDLAVGMIRFENGAMLNIEASFVAHISEDVFNFSLMGTKGGATWDPATLYTDRVGHMVNMKPNFVGKVGWGDIWVSKMRNFVEHCLYDKPTMAPAEDGLAVQKMLDGIYASASKGGKEVAIK